MKKIAFGGSLLLLLALSAFYSFASAADALTVPQLTQKIAEVEKKNIMLTGTILGACVSGCKMWVGEEPYKKGDAYVLVWAKDDAFRFKTDAAGKKVRLQGFAVGQYIDLCAKEKKQEEGLKEGESCAKPEALGDKQDKQLDSITFFATEVEYL